MMRPPLKHRTETHDQHLANDLERVNSAERERVLARIRARRSPPPRGIPGSELLKFAGTISEETLQQIEQVIEEECEQIDYDGW